MHASKRRSSLLLGSFGRSFSLHDDASPAKVSAEFKDSVLIVPLVKDEKAGPSKSRSKLFKEARP